MQLQHIAAYISEPSAATTCADATVTHIPWVLETLECWVLIESSNFELYLSDIWNLYMVINFPIYFK